MKPIPYSTFELIAEQIISGNKDQGDTAAALEMIYEQGRQYGQYEARKNSDVTDEHWRVF